MNFDLQNLPLLKEIFLNPKDFEMESPFLSTDRIDETQTSLNRFGHVRIFFSSRESLEPLTEKINCWSKEKTQNCAYFFKPIWDREGDPYKVPMYRVYLTGWKLQTGGLEISPDQKNTILKTVKLLTARGLPLVSDE